MLNELMDNRRAFRALKKTQISESAIREMIRIAVLAPSCFNNQPWRYTAINDESVLEKFKSVYSEGNSWCFNASAIIIVWTKNEFDCIIKERKYAQFDTGLATGYLILKAVEMGYVAHPIAGFSPKKVRQFIKGDDSMDIISLVILGKKSEDLAMLNSNQLESEKNRPERKKTDEILNFFKETD